MTTRAEEGTFADHLALMDSRMYPSTSAGFS